MPQGADQEKTEPATPKRLQEMREKGQVAKSREVPSVAILIAGLLIFYFLGATMIRDFMDLMKWAFTNSGTLQLKEANLHWLLIELFRRGLKIVAPLFVALVVVHLLLFLDLFPLINTFDPITIIIFTLYIFTYIY